MTEKNQKRKNTDCKQCLYEIEKLKDTENNGDFLFYYATATILSFYPILHHVMIWI